MHPSCGLWLWFPVIDIMCLCAETLADLAQKKESGNGFPMMCSHIFFYNC
jgi:hypothetical protein